MNKEALLQETYDSAFNDELEKISGKFGDLVVPALKGALKNPLDMLKKDGVKRRALGFANTLVNKTGISRDLNKVLYNGPDVLRGLGGMYSKLKTFS